ncbi:hypothetical protein ACF0H5_021702 [Mactra antiquata]
MRRSINNIKSLLRHVHTSSRVMKSSINKREESPLIQRVNQHVNYKRRFINPEKVEVTVPSLPYQAFDMFSAGTRIKPWCLLNLVVSIRLFTQHPAKHTDNPENSIVDTHILQRDHLIFAVGFKMNIDRSFHAQDSLKFPLKVLAEFTNAGKSSGRRVCTVTHSSNENRPYIVCEMDEVLVSKETRRPISYPAWWISKFSHLIKEKNKLILPKKPTDLPLYKSEIIIEFEHMDHNAHTTMSAYLKFCSNVAFRIAMERNSRGFTLDNFGAGIKCIHMQFYNESGYGDKLVVKSWLNEDLPGQINFELYKLIESDHETNEVLCCAAFLQFFQPLMGKL